MTRQELMIGDIVNVHRCECVADGGHFQEWNEYGKVVSITEDYITIKYIGREEDYGFEDVNEEDINPIPLTPEILEKNGFKECTNGDWTNDNVDFIFYRRKDGIFRIQNTNMTLPYVSSFQHALRLCSINKEIEI